jgi:acetoin utilization deacetylase AcuC-like enzyme
MLPLLLRMVSSDSHDIVNKTDWNTAHLQHGIRRVVILDIDLHHGNIYLMSLFQLIPISPMTGNGTQAIAWQINEETYRKTLETEYSESETAPPETPGLKIYYGSIHDILSYPCEVSGIAGRLSYAFQLSSTGR